MNATQPAKESNMKTSPQTRTANGNEAQALLARPVSHGQRRLARQMAEQIGGPKAYRMKTARLLRSALATFGGELTRLELPAQ